MRIRANGLWMIDAISSPVHRCAIWQVANLPTRLRGRLPSHLGMGHHNNSSQTKKSALKQEWLIFSTFFWCRVQLKKKHLGALPKRCAQLSAAFLLLHRSLIQVINVGTLVEVIVTIIRKLVDFYFFLPT